MRSNGSRKFSRSSDLGGIPESPTETKQDHTIRKLSFPLFLVAVHFSNFNSSISASISESENEDGEDTDLEEEESGGGGDARKRTSRKTGVSTTEEMNEGMSTAVLTDRILNKLATGKFFSFLILGCLQVRVCNVL